MNLKKKFDNIKFIDCILCNKSDILEILDIRNENSIRNNMFNNKLISKEDHLNWFGKIKNSDSNKFYFIKYNNEIIGGFGLKEKNQNKNYFEWSLYISQKIKIFSLGALAEFKALNYFFSNYKVTNLFCYVLKKNTTVINLHKKFGFNEVDLDKNFNLLYPDMLLKDVIYLLLEKSRWSIINKKFNNKFFNT
jgi:UDP-4-amino-4,6-dideoxy-N-acetyl-beta-L-altrosamine N-acetyltransferase